jgi:hypothetical protein
MKLRIFFSSKQEVAVLWEEALLRILEFSGRNLDPKVRLA